MNDDDFRAVAASLIRSLGEAAPNETGSYGMLFTNEGYRQAAVEILTGKLGMMYRFGRVDERNGRSLHMPDSDRSMPRKRLSYLIDEDESYC